MTDLVTELTQRAQALSPEERVRLAELLLDSVRPPADVENEQAWDEELVRRIDEVERGVAKLIPAEEVFAEVRRAIR